MTEDRVALLELAENHADGDCLRELEASTCCSG